MRWRMERAELGVYARCRADPSFQPAALLTAPIARLGRSSGFKTRRPAARLLASFGTQPDCENFMLIQEKQRE